MWRPRHATVTELYTWRFGVIVKDLHLPCTVFKFTLKDLFLLISLLPKRILNRLSTPAGYQLWHTSRRCFSRTSILYWNLHIRSYIYYFVSLHREMCARICKMLDCLQEFVAKFFRSWCKYSLIIFFKLLLKIFLGLLHFVFLNSIRSSFWKCSKSSFCHYFRKRFWDYTP